MLQEHKKIFFSLTDWQLMGLCIERESGGEPREGQIAVGTVILERVDHRDWDGKTIKEVILKPWQFSWTMPEAGEDYYNVSVRIAKNWIESYRDNHSLQECCTIALGLINGSISRDLDLVSVHCCEYVAGSFRKHLDANPIIKGNRWWQKMRLIKVIAGHEFYVGV
jgi:hypothetical protein